MPRRRDSDAWIVPVLFGLMATLSITGVLLTFNLGRLPSQRSNYANAPRHKGPVAPLSELHGEGVIYLVQLTPHQDNYSVESLAEWLRKKYALDVRVLPPRPIDKSAWDSERHQYVAELLYAQIKREHPALAGDPHAWLIGFTDADMYSVVLKWGSTFTQRDPERSAIVSSFRLKDRPGLLATAADRQELAREMQARLRRALLKDVALLYWHLPLNNDPSSLLEQPMNVDLPTEDIYESDLNPARSSGGQFEGAPCIFFAYSARAGIHPLPGRLIRGCADVQIPLADGSIELFQVDLRNGGFVAKHTDLSVPGSIPIRFEHVLYAGWTGDSPFGGSGTDSYDAYLSSRDNIRISVVEDGFSNDLIRNPMFDIRPNHLRYVDANMSGRYYEMQWTTQPYPHYNLRRYDGQVEEWLPCLKAGQFCYLNAIRNAQGQELKFTRDSSRHLLQLTTPESDWLKIAYGPREHIAQIDDSLGHTVRYSYNSANQLTGIVYPDGESLAFAYDSANRLLTFSAAPDAKTPPRVMLRNTWDNGMLVRQELADGGVYTYAYAPSTPARVPTTVRMATVIGPDNKIYSVSVGWESSYIWEQDLPGQPAAPAAAVR